MKNRTVMLLFAISLCLSSFCGYVFFLQLQCEQGALEKPLVALRQAPLNKALCTKSVTVEEKLFAQKQSPYLFSYPHFQEKIVLFYLPPKPGCVEGTVQIQLKGQKQVKTVTPNKPLYFGYSPKNRPCRWSMEEKSEFSLTPVFITKNQVVFRADLAKKQLSVEEQKDVIWKIPIQTIVESKDLIMPCFSDIISQSVFLGEDLFAKDYEGEKKFWVSFGKQGPLRLAQGDVLSYDGKKWVITSRLEICHNRACCRLESAKQGSLQFAFWDSSGKRYALFSCKKSALPLFSCSGESFVKGIYIKTPQKVVLSLESCPMIMEKKQWAVKQNNRWRLVLPEESLLTLLQKYPTFFFEKMCKKGRKKWLSGKLYSPFRTSCVLIEKEILYKNHKISRK